MTTRKITGTGGARAVKDDARAATAREQKRRGRHRDDPPLIPLPMSAAMGGGDHPIDATEAYAEQDRKDRRKPQDPHAALAQVKPGEVVQEGGRDPDERDPGCFEGEGRRGHVWETKGAPGAAKPEPKKPTL